MEIREFFFTAETLSCDAGFPLNIDIEC